MATVYHCPECPACRDEPVTGGTTDRFLCPNAWCIVLAWNPNYSPSKALREAETKSWCRPIS